MRRTAAALALTALTITGAATAAQATPDAHGSADDPTSHPGPGRRLVCLDGVRQLWLTPDEEDIPGTAPVPGPCPGQAPPTTGAEPVLLCIQGTTVEGRRGWANPNGYLYHEGPCDEPAKSATSTTAAPRAKAPAAVRARPRFTG
jgi:hypothetical protein